MKRDRFELHRIFASKRRFLLCGARLAGSELLTEVSRFLLLPVCNPTRPTFQDSDGPSRQDSVQPPVFPALRHSRAVSSTSEEEEALTEKFLKINCKYITDGKVG